MKSAENKSTIIVLAMHRSGSSAVAGILHYLGVDMGAEYFISADENNPKGYFEDGRFLLLNTLIMRSVGCAWNTNPFAFDEWIDCAKAKFDTQIKELVSSRAGIWGWKDPRTVTTLPLFMSHLGNPKFVVVVRGHHAIARSLYHRDKIPIGDGLKFSQDYYARIGQWTLDYACPFICVYYENIIRSPYTEIERLADFTGLHGNVPREFIQ